MNVPIPSPSPLLRFVYTLRTLRFASALLLAPLLSAQFSLVAFEEDIAEIEVMGIPYASTDAVFFGWSAFDSGAVALPRFDPALGILQAIQLSVNFELGVWAELQVGDVLEETEDSSASFDTFDRPLFFGLYYTDPRDNSFVDIAEESLDVALFLFQGAPPVPGEGVVDDNFFESISLSITVFDLAHGIDLVDANDFIGSGIVATNLRPSLLIPLSGTFALDNVSDAEAFIISAIVNGWVEIEYTYVIPEPAHAVALVSLFGLLYALRRRCSRGQA